MPRPPLVNLNLELLPRNASQSEEPSSPIERPKTSWKAYLSLAILIFLILLPQYSYITVVLNHYVTVEQASWTAARHISITTLLTLLIFTSITVCCTRDPGKPRIGETEESTTMNHGEGDSLMGNKPFADDDFNSSKNWCRACWAPKFERTHHCSTCGRCVLKMDHHCPWLMDKCVGHRTYPAFLHLLFCVTALSLYMGTVGAFTLHWYLFAPYPQIIDDTTPLHALLITLMGFIFTLVFGSFFGYHIYLCTINSTTIENISAPLLLRYLPPSKLSAPRHAPGTSITGSLAPQRSTRAPYQGGEDDDINEMASPYHFPSPPPTPPPPSQHQVQMNRHWEEHELTYEQRRALRYAHRNIRLYDLGWKANFSQTLGIASATKARNFAGKLRRWVELFAYGGRARGDGKTFPMNPKAQKQLLQLANELDALKDSDRTVIRPAARYNYDSD